MPKPQKSLGKSFGKPQDAAQTQEIQALGKENGAGKIASTASKKRLDL